MAFGRQLLQASAKFAQHVQLVRNSHNTRTTPLKFAQPMRGAKFPLFPPTPLQIFSFRYFCINFHSSPCNPPIIRFLSQEGWKKFSIYIPVHPLQKGEGQIYGDGWRYKYINIQTIQSFTMFFSLLLFFPISIFLVAKQPLRAFPQRMIG